MRKNIVNEKNYVVSVSEIIELIQKNNFRFDDKTKDINDMFKAISFYQQQNAVHIDSINISKENPIQMHFKLNDYISIDDVRNAYAYAIFEKNKYYIGVLESYIEIFILDKAEELAFSKFYYGLDYVIENRGYNYLTGKNEEKEKDLNGYFIDEDFVITKMNPDNPKINNLKD